MKHQRDYTTCSGAKERLKNLIVAIVLAAELIAGGLILFGNNPEPNGWDVSVPMANAHVCWEQTYYGGRMP